MALKYVSIVLKIVEIVILLAATGTIAHFMKEARDDIDDTLKKDTYDNGTFGRYEFFLYTTCIGVIIASLSLVGVFIELEKKGGTLAMIVVYALWALQLLISAALLAKVLAAGEEKKLVQPNQFVPPTKISDCERLENLDKRYHCSELEGGVACGFIAALVFAVDAVICKVMSIRQSSA